MSLPLSKVLPPTCHRHLWIALNDVGVFGMVISKAPGSDGAAHFMIEIEDDPFKCGKHAVEVVQNIQTGELSEFKFHSEEKELSQK